MPIFGALLLKIYFFECLANNKILKFQLNSTHQNQTRAN